MTGTGARRGRPRSEFSRQSILAAADELLLVRGLEDVSMDEVAERAGCSKATIYRWWASKQQLALEALLISWESVVRGSWRETGSIRGDLRAQMRPWVRRLEERHYAPVIAALIAEAHRDPAFGTVWRETFVETRRDLGRETFARAIARGEIAADTDVELALDQLFGPLYHRLLHGHQPVTVKVAYRLIDAVLLGIATPAVRDTIQDV